MTSRFYEHNFAHALTIVRAIPVNNSTLQPSAADKLQFYGLYKQATKGDVNIARPSSRQVVEYAKWKSWSRMKGMSSVEAQKLYVESLTQLLTELVDRYSHHELVPFLKSALDSLHQSVHIKTNHSHATEGEDLFQDAYDYTTEFELHQSFLDNIEPDHIRQETDILNSPTTPTAPITPITPNAPETTSIPSPLVLRYSNHDIYHNYINNDEHSTYPLTPAASPGYLTAIAANNTGNTSQWVLNQLQNNINVNSSSKSYYHAMINSNNDLISEADTADREVAAVTANLLLKSPTYSPYTPTFAVSNNSLQPRSRKKSLASSSTNASNNKKDMILEKLQTEVTALTEQIDRLQQSIKLHDQKEKHQLRWTTAASFIIKTLLKHVLVNSAILFIGFYILWCKKSPLAYSIINYLMPKIQAFIRSLVRKIIFWKISV